MGKPMIAVVGGGITGAFAAYYATLLGVDVTVLQRDDPLLHASGNNTGGLNPMHGPGIPGPVADLARASFELHRQAWPAITAAGTADFAGRGIRRLDLALDAEDVVQLRDSVERYAETPGFAATWLGPDEVREVEPALTADVVGGLLVEGNLRVDPAAYTRAVIAAAEQAGARFMTAEVTDVQSRDDHVTGLVTDVGVLACDGMIVATGPWCAEPGRWLRIALPIEPVRGELLVAEQPDPPISADLGWGRFGVHPRADGMLLLGGTEESAGFDATPTAAGCAGIRAGVGRFLAAVDVLRIVAHTAALRPVSADGLPICGFAPGWGNVTLAMGGGRKGMLLAPALGHSAVDLLIHGETDLAVHGLGAQRPGLMT